MTITKTIIYFLMVLFLIETIFPKIITLKFSTLSHKGLKGIDNLKAENKDDKDMLNRIYYIENSLFQDKLKITLVIIQSLLLIGCFIKLCILNALSTESMLLFIIQTILSADFYLILSQYSKTKKYTYLYSTLLCLTSIGCIIFIK